MDSSGSAFIGMRCARQAHTSTPSATSKLHLCTGQRISLTYVLRNSSVHRPVLKLVCALDLLIHNRDGHIVHSSICLVSGEGWGFVAPSNSGAHAAQEITGSQLSRRRMARIRPRGQLITGRADDPDPHMTLTHSRQHHPRGQTCAQGLPRVEPSEHH
ncbi:unnamed protein product [Schistocephalus solidus]|uniref:DUF11 domain-containing protein n=1 Tax=Schistocephalus solidus TaxID=70667 RepID=A0A183SWR4_SCHSO|nr:unnamed protein product [Schistocephalus solidus]